MARDSTCEASSWEEAFRWQRRPQRRPEEPGVTRDVAVDPFSLRQFSRVDIDRPLPIPCWWDDGARSIAHSGELPRSKLSLSLSLSAAGGETAELADAAGLDVALSSSAERKASEPQRWGSDVPLIAAAADAEKYSFGGYYAGTKDDDGRGKHASKAPFTCCMFVPASRPGLTRRIVSIKPPTSSSMGAKPPARSSSSAKSGNSTTAAVQHCSPIDDAGTCSARPSTVSLAVSLERFDCGALGLDGGGDGDGEAAASASSYFDLPLELILGCGEEDDADLPVCAAFLFDSDGIRKSVLKRSLEVGAGWEPRRPSLGKVSMDAAGNPQVRVSLKSRSP